MIGTSVMQELEEYNFMAALVYLIVINRGVFRTLPNICDGDFWGKFFIFCKKSHLICLAGT